MANLNLFIVFLFSLMALGANGEFKDIKLIGKSGTKMYYIADTPTSWADSLTICQLNNMYLATIENERDFNFVQKYQRKERGQNEPKVWLSATDYMNEGKYYWFRNRRPVTFNKFPDGVIPTYNEPWYNCVYQASGSIDSNENGYGSWGTTYCDSNLPGYARALCET